MARTNKTSHFECRFLADNELNLAHKTFISAFADYVIEFQLSQRQFRNHMILNAVDLSRSVGCILDGRLIGLSLNGFGDWEGKRTVYDAGTGVLPEFRRRGASRAMFDWMIPQFAAEGHEQFLLEVVTENEPAVNLYKKLGFYITRELLLLEAEHIHGTDHTLPEGFEIREMHRHENIPYALFWDGKPSWQNSIEAVERSLYAKRVLGAFVGDECVGYAVYSGNTGRLAQMAVRRDYRRCGIGTRLLAQMQKDAAGEKLLVINLDESMTEAVVYFRNRGFHRTFSQYEMIRPF